MLTDQVVGPGMRSEKPTDAGICMGCAVCQTPILVGGVKNRKPEHSPHRFRSGICQVGNKGYVIFPDRYSDVANDNAILYNRSN